MKHGDYGKPDPQDSSMAIAGKHAYNQFSVWNCCVVNHLPREGRVWPVVDRQIAQSNSQIESLSSSNLCHWTLLTGF